MVTDYFSGKYLGEKYDALAETYTEHRSAFDNTRQLQELNKLIPGNSMVLDIGCGSGLPVARYFVEHGNRVIGIDVSKKMIELARKDVPEAEFHVEDILSSDFKEGSFDLIVSFYCLFHIRKEKQKGVFAEIREWLKPGGYTYFTLALSEYTGKDEFDGTVEFDGIPLPYSHYSVDEYKNIFNDLNFKTISVDKLIIGGETMLWALLERP